jgi:hypothetical protein
MGMEHMIPVFERTKAVHAVIGSVQGQIYILAEEGVLSEISACRGFEL